MRDKRKTKPKEQYLKLYYYMLGMEGISLVETFFLAHIHSYGIKGCWQGNETLGKMFFTSARSISKWLANLKKHNLVYWVHHTNNTTNKDTIRATIERPLPLPAGGQAPAALEQRTEARLDLIDNFKHKFGIGSRKKFTPLSEAEFQDKKQKQRQALFATNK